jgi:hypothetical protein
MPNNQFGVQAQQSLGQAAPVSRCNLAVPLDGALKVGMEFVHALHSLLQTTARMAAGKAMGNVGCVFLE